MGNFTLMHYSANGQLIAKARVPTVAQAHAWLDNPIPGKRCGPPPLKDLCAHINMDDDAAVDAAFRRQFENAHPQVE